MRNTDKTVVDKQIMHSSVQPLLQPLSFPSSPSLAKSHEQQQQEHDVTSNTKLQLPSYIIYINVGGRVFTTTTYTMKKSALFNKLLSLNHKSPLNHAPLITNRETTFASYCNEYKEKEEEIVNIDHEQHGIYQINPNYYFVDRSPCNFDDILHFLRNYPKVNAQQFIERYCGLNNMNQHMTTITKIQSLSSVLTASSNDASSTSKMNLNLLKLQDEARFYSLDSLVNAIEEKLDFNKYNKAHYKWWDRSGSLNGLRRISGTKIAFATAMDNWVDIDAEFEIPQGFIWATQSQYLQEYHAKGDTLNENKEWIHFGIGDWDNYRWKYARNIAFIFKDTFKGLRFVHSGMEVCDINHVKSLCGYMAESSLMTFDDNKGIVQGFAGLVLLSDKVWNESPPSETSSWTSDEDDEQIQSLKKQTLKPFSSLPIQSTVVTEEKKELKKPVTAKGKIAVSCLPRPQLANGDYRRRAALTKNNLMKHTELENNRHKERDREKEKYKHREYKSYKPQPPHYIHHQLPRYNFIGGNQFAAPPQPQLMPRLSVNSLPAPNINHLHIKNHIHHPQKQ